MNWRASMPASRFSLLLMSVLIAPQTGTSAFASECHASYRVCAPARARLYCNAQPKCVTRKSPRRRPSRKSEQFYSYDRAYDENQLSNNTQWAVTEAREVEAAPPPPAPMLSAPPPPFEPAPATPLSVAPPYGNVFNFYGPTTNYFGAVAPERIWSANPDPRSERLDPWRGYSSRSPYNGY